MTTAVTSNVTSTNTSSVRPSRNRPMGGRNATPYVTPATNDTTRERRQPPSTLAATIGTRSRRAVIVGST